MRYNIIWNISYRSDQFALKIYGQHVALEAVNGNKKAKICLFYLRYCQLSIEYLPLNNVAPHKRFV